MTRVDLFLDKRPLWWQWVATSEGVAGVARSAFASWYMVLNVAKGLVSAHAGARVLATVLDAGFV